MEKATPTAPEKAAKALPEKTAKALTPKQKFMASLSSGPEYELKFIAKALYAATRARQESLHQHLRRGDLIASVNWPMPSDVTDLPSTIWRDAAVGKLRVRSMRAGRWRLFNYALPSSLLTRHLVAPMLRYYQSLSNAGLGGEIAPPAEPPTPGAPLYGTTNMEHLLTRALYMLETGAPAATVVVTAPNARLFAENVFGAERRGRPKAPDAELLLAEIFRRLHRIPFDRLPLQKTLVFDMHQWWQSSPARERRSEDWVELYVERAYATLSNTAPSS
jgi:hypothetical protein